MEWGAVIAMTSQYSGHNPDLYRNQTLFTHTNTHTPILIHCICLGIYCSTQVCHSVFKAKHKAFLLGFISISVSLESTESRPESSKACFYLFLKAFGLLYK